MKIKKMPEPWPYDGQILSDALNTLYENELAIAAKVWRKELDISHISEEKKKERLEKVFAINKMKDKELFPYYIKELVKDFLWLPFFEDRYGWWRYTAFIPMMLLCKTLLSTFKLQFVKKFMFILVDADLYSEFTQWIKTNNLNPLTLKLLDANYSLGFNERLSDQEFTEILDTWIRSWEVETRNQEFYERFKLKISDMLDSKVLDLRQMEQ